MTLLILLLGLVSVVYHTAALTASLLFRLRKAKKGPYAPGVSILKPVYGLDEGFYEAIESHARQEYGEFEILFGVHHLDDAGVPAIRRLMGDYPGVRIRLIETGEGAPNGKVHSLIALAKEARHDVLLMNDSDVEVPAGYLARVAAPLADPAVGLVTCIYRAEARTVAGRWEALGIATDFIPSTLVAPMVGIREFGLGSTLCFRRADLEAIGGFEVLEDYVADDYQLARRITALGKHSHLSDVVVTTHLSDPDWRAVWQHQVRWARTIRVSRGDGYLGLPVTHAGVWALAAWLAGIGWLSLVLLVARVASGLAGGVGVLGQRWLLPLFPLLPVWDLWAFAVWVTGLGGRTVIWRGKRLRLQRDGRLG